MDAIEVSMNNEEDIKKKKQTLKDISALEAKKSRMTDMLIDGIISKDDYEDKLSIIMRKLHNLEGKKQIIDDSLDRKKDVENRMANLRQILDNNEILDEFDRVVFENVIDKVYVGGYNEDGTPDPYKLTFELKGKHTGVIPDAKKHFKKSKNSKQGKRVL